MNRLEFLSAWFFTTLGVALLAVSVLVVPEKAFADANSDCSAACCTGCFGSGSCDTMSSCWMSCQGSCTGCEAGCGSNTACQALCLTTARAGQCPTNSCGTACENPGGKCVINGLPDICVWSPGKSSCTCKY